MKKTIFLVAAVILLGCKQLDPKLLNPTGQPLSNKLPAMESYVENNLVAIVDPNGQTIGANPQDVKTLFDRQATEIITNPYGEKRGYLVLKVNTIKTKLSLWGGLLGMYTVTLLNVCGVPFASAKASVEVQIDIMDAKRRLIGSYRGSGYSKLDQGYYSKTNYNRINLQRVAYLEAVRQGINEAMTKLTPDTERLNTELGK